MDRATSLPPLAIHPFNTNAPDAQALLTSSFRLSPQPICERTASEPPLSNNPLHSPITLDISLWGDIEYPETQDSEDESDSGIDRTSVQNSPMDNEGLRNADEEEKDLGLHESFGEKDIQ